MYGIFFSAFLGYVDKFIWYMEAFTDDRSLNIVEDFGLGPIHYGPFGGRKIVSTTLNKLGEMEGLVNREKMEKGFKNTTGIATLVLKEFQFTLSSFNYLSQ